ncbi:MAG: T9SS type A sorting domain-containing protein [Sphingobacteriaceae bacterium]|nr:T9SS type A sorting domain-containing protein [Sphingobacteriaceae bacterium]
MYHTFQGGCAIPGDNVADTPECDYLGGSYGCHSSPTSTLPINCNNVLINAENYMDYSSNSGCFKMFTQGQVSRAYASLYHPSRFPLWQPSNLIATGLGNLCPGTNINNSFAASTKVLVYPNPNNGTFEIQINNEITVGELILTNCLGQIVHKQKLIQGLNKIDAIKLSNGFYHYAIFEGKQQIGIGKLVIE